MKYVYFVCLLSLGQLWAGPSFKAVNTVPAQHICTDVQALQKVARNTLAFIKKHEHKEWFAPVKRSILEKHGATLADVKKTLSFIVWVIEHDRGKAKQRMADPEFLRKHFAFIQWHPDVESAQTRKVTYVDDSNIRVTKYLAFKVAGSYKKTKECPYALYSVPLKHQDLLTKYTKQQVIDGALDKAKQFKPLVWLSRDGVEEALMQGTIYVTMPDKKERVFNVDCNNGIPYEQALKDKYAQKRYWAFKEVQGALGWGDEVAQVKIPIVPGVTFAGDVYSFGLGQIIALCANDPLTGLPSMRLGVLADTGGAFKDNLFQLDFFTGVFASREVFDRETKNVAVCAQAFFVVKKA